MLCLPKALWTDYRCVYLRRRRRRIWIVLCEMEALRAMGVLSGNLAVLSANLGVTQRQLVRDLTELRDLGLVPEGEIWPDFGRSAANEVCPEAMAAPQTRPRYASDERYNERRRGTRQQNSVTPPRSAATPPEPCRSDADTPPADTVPVPVTGPVTGPDPVLINTLIPVPGPVPVSAAERMKALGMEQAKAEERVAEFGEARCRDALDALAASSKPVSKPIGFVVDFLVHQRPLPRALREARERDQKRAAAPSGRLSGRRPGTVPPGSAEARSVPFARRRELLVNEPTPAEVTAWRQRVQARLDSPSGEGSAAG